jgi:hypothetical protein
MLSPGSDQNDNRKSGEPALLSLDLEVSFTNKKSLLFRFQFWRSEWMFIDSEELLQQSVALQSCFSFAYPRSSRFLLNKKMVLKNRLIV